MHRVLSKLSLRMYSHPEGFFFLFANPHCDTPSKAAAFAQAFHIPEASLQNWEEERKKLSYKSWERYFKGICDRPCAG